MTYYRITNQVHGYTIIVDELPKGVRVGVADIGPSYNNQPPPKLIVEELEGRLIPKREHKLGW